MATEVQLDEEKLEAFVERIVLDVGTAMRGGLLYIGDRLGITYFLPPEHALPLADEEFPFFSGGLVQMIVPTVTVAPQVAEAFKSGRGITQDQYLGAPASVPGPGEGARACLRGRLHALSQAPDRGPLLGSLRAQGIGAVTA